jgi:alpha-D-ribose 1-methylphosphonate 5-triphosphate synthase subunit PhnH
MNINLSTLSQGFENVGRDSQIIFRQIMGSFARPGLPVEISPLVKPSPEFDVSVAGSLLLALMETGTALYLPNEAQISIWANYLKFHTACVLTPECQNAEFIWIQDGAHLPSLLSCALGSVEFPETSSTLIIDVNGIEINSESMDAKVWTGPGIKEPIQIDIQGISTAFWRERKELRQMYPCGVDVIFCSSTQIVSLPRSTRIGE